MIERFSLGPLDLDLSVTAGVTFFSLRNRMIPGGTPLPLAEGVVQPQMARELNALARRLKERGLHRPEAQS